MGAIPHHYTKCGGGAKNSGGRLHDKFKLIKNTFSVYLDIFNSGLLLISGEFKASDRNERLVKKSNGIVKYFLRIYKYS